jgi:hypothetical protein
MPLTRKRKLKHSKTHSKKYSKKHYHKLTKKTQSGGIKMPEFLNKDINFRGLASRISNLFYKPRPKTLPETIREATDSVTNTVSLGKLGGTRKKN